MILFGATLIGAALVAVLSGALAWVLGGREAWSNRLPWLVLLPWAAVSGGAAYHLHQVAQALVATETGLAVVAGSLAQALMLCALGPLAVLIPATAAALRAPRTETRGRAFLPLILVPFLAVFQYLFFEYTLLPLARLLLYGVLAYAVRRRGEPGLAVLGVVMVSGEWANVAAAHFDLFTTLGQLASGVESMRIGLKLISAGRWVGLTVVAAAFAAQVIGSKRPKPTWAVIPLAVAAGFAADATSVLILLLSPVSPG